MNHSVALALQLFGFVGNDFVLVSKPSMFVADNTRAHSAHIVAGSPDPDRGHAAQDLSRSLTSIVGIRRLHRPRWWAQ